MDDRWHEDQHPYADQAKPPRLTYPKRNEPVTPEEIDRWLVEFLERTKP